MPHEEFHDPLAPPDPLRDWYVNTIWGKRVDDDDLLFEVMSLQVFQAGLTWRMILNKRDGFRSAFDNWSISTVAGFSPAEVEALRNAPGILRNRLKIQSAINNAECLLKIQREPGGFDRFIWAFTSQDTIRTTGVITMENIPAKTAESELVSPNPAPHPLNGRTSRLSRTMQVGLRLFHAQLCGGALDFDLAAENAFRRAGESHVG